MQPVLTAAQMREVDRLSTEKYDIPSLSLMENAARAAARVITEKLGGSVAGKAVLILCGPGNNGGDGAALARLLSGAGAEADVVLFGKVQATKGDARTNFASLADASLGVKLFEIGNAEEWRRYFAARERDIDVAVDAIFGTGLTRPPDDTVSAAIRDLNSCRVSALREKPPLAVAIDIPTGLNADSGDVLGETFRADVTVTFTAPKPGNVLPHSAEFNGELVVADIGSPESLVVEQRPQLFLAVEEDARKWLEMTAFSAGSYKGKRGHSLVIAGSRQYSGAAVLAANAAMRSGAGLVTLVAPESSVPLIAPRTLPEVMIRSASETDGGAIAEKASDEIADLLEKADAVAIGCGLSQSESTRHFVEWIVKGRQRPIVIDADALNMLAPFANDGSDGPPIILTPHVGEFLRLLGAADEAALADRVSVVRKFAAEQNVILVLKGERILIGSPDGRVVINPTGTPGLGKAGNGDTLTGIIAGFIAQAAVMNVDIFDTTVAAAFIAGMAGDIAERKFGKRVMTASDVREALAETFATLRRPE